MDKDRRRLLLYGLGGVSTVAAGTIGISEMRDHRRGPFRSPDDPHATKIPDRPGYLPTRPLPPARRKLGRTGLDVSIVAMGAGGITVTDPIHRAVDKGINYIDTSTCYGGSEDVIGRAVREDKSLRDKLMIATKWDSGIRAPKARMLESLDSSLRRLGVDVIDIMQVHWLGGGHVPSDNGYNRLDNPELYEAMDMAKKAGKVRFFGATSHDGARSKILRYAIDKGAFDMILVKINVLDNIDADMPALLAHAKEKNIGVVAMKSQPSGGKIPLGFENSKWNIYQSNLRWVLSQDVACVVESKIGTDSKRQDLAMGAAEDPFTMNDAGILEKYATALSPVYCRGCSQHCTGACPDGVAISHVLQFAMYAREYAWPAYARELYGALPEAERWSDRCASCSACSDACPFGVDAAAGVRKARGTLT